MLPESKCGCGCGRATTKTYVKGHNFRLSRAPWNIGLTKDTDARVAAAAQLLLGHSVSLSTRAKLAKFCSGNTSHLGYKLTEDQRKRVSQGTIAAMARPSVRRLVLLGAHKRKGVPLTDEHKRKTGKGVAAWWRSHPEACQAAAIRLSRRNKGPEFLAANAGKKGGLREWTPEQRQAQSIRAKQQMEREQLTGLYRNNAGLTSAFLGKGVPTLTCKRIVKWLTEFGIKGLVLEHCIGRYFIDIALPSKRLAVEIDGPWHTRPKQIKSDKRKDRRLRSIGWSVKRFPVSIRKWNLRAIAEFLTS